MRMQTSFLPLGLMMLLSGCRLHRQVFDAEGVFEADETVISSEVSGKIITLNVEEGALLAKDSIVAVIDSIPLELQKSQVIATIHSLKKKTADVTPQVKLLREQIAAQKIQLANLLLEKDRTERLIRAEAATTKQLDDYNNQIRLLEKQIDVNEQQILVQRSAVGTQNNTVMSEALPLQRSVAQIEDQLKRTNVINPVAGIVLAKYAMPGEVTAAGKPLYKIADLSLVTLRTYVSGTQLSGLKIDQAVSVFVDADGESYREYPGRIISISDKAEFTPKTIQTREERANLVYAVRIHVKNDGYIKIGMYGEVRFGDAAKEMVGIKIPLAKATRPGQGLPKK